MNAVIDILISASFWAAVIRIASPMILATMGELICERAGVLNLGIEGIMVIGAFAGWMAVYQGLPLWGGVAVAMAAGMLFGLLHSTFTVPFGLSQHVVGLGVTLLATSSASFAYRLMLPEVTSPPKIAPFQPLHVPGLSDLPWLGEALSQTALTWAAFAVAGLVAFMLYRTPLGLAVRAVGENPAAVDTAGISVPSLRFSALMVTGVLCGLAGAYMATALQAGFGKEMTAGRGYIALAALIFAKWRPIQAMYACLLFGFFQALALRPDVVEKVVQVKVPVPFLDALPYILTVLVLAGFVGKAIPPRAGGEPYVKER